MAKITQWRLAKQLFCHLDSWHHHSGIVLVAEQSGARPWEVALLRMAEQPGLQLAAWPPISRLTSHGQGARPWEVALLGIPGLAQQSG